MLTSERQNGTHILYLYAVYHNRSVFNLLL